ncbi:MAG: trigger factor [Deltaproteobacteria bacterium]|nr:trigger factor [Deltaproteobacteria bacterium]
MEATELNYQVNVESTSDVERKLDVEVPWTEVKGRLDEAYKELARGVSVKGFRRGRVPRKMLERMFSEHVNKEVEQRLVQDSMTKALIDEEINPVAEPEVDNEAGIADGESFRYSVTLQVVPEVEPKDYFGVEVAQRPAKVEDKDVDAALEERRRRQTEYKPIEGRTTAHGDVLLIDLMGKLGNAPYDQENQIVELAEPPKEPLAGLAAKLTGIQAEPNEEGGYEDLEVELEIPAQEDGAAAQKARLLVTVKDIKQKIVPELNDEFAQNTGEVETLVELREKLRIQLLADDEKRAREEAKHRLIGVLLTKNDVPVVPALVEQHLDRTIRLQSEMFGLDPEMLTGDEDLKDRLRSEAEKTVRGALLIGGIAKKEAVEVHDADVEKKLAEVAAAQEENVARVRSDYEAQGRMEQLRAELREEKTLDLLMSKANIVVKEIPEDEATSGGSEDDDAVDAEAKYESDSETGADV